MQPTSLNGLAVVEQVLSRFLNSAHVPKPLRGNLAFMRFVTFVVRVGLLGFLALFVLLLGGCGAAYYRFGRDLPSHREVVDYEPSTITRVYASDGALMAEYAQEKRLFVPIEAIPQHVRNAFLAAEDKDFYSHGGVDFLSLASASVRNVSRVLAGRRPAGASTITQQVAKNFITGDDFSVDRKIKEGFIAWRLEADLDKDRILELYLNEIFYGVHSYGIAQAALTYFDKSVGELTIAEGAYLAAVINGPSVNHPVRHKQRATARRDWIIGQMLKNKFITQEQHDEAIATELVATLSPGREIIDNAGYFSAEVRRQLVQQFGESAVKTDGLNVRSTMQQDFQNLAKETLQDGLVDYDRRHGWRGAEANIDIGGGWLDALNNSEEAAQLAREVPEDWRVAVVTRLQNQSASIGFANGEEGVIGMSQMRWAKPNRADQSVGPEPSRPSQVLDVGDIISVSKRPDSDPQQWSLTQIPEVEGALVAMDPHTGRVLALVGGFDFEKSNYNRATQAQRQPGSTFKPFVFLAGINAGYSPTTLIMDSPWIVKGDRADEDDWRPVNYDGRFLGPQPMHVGLEWSRNLMTVRLAAAVGMDRVVEYAKAFGIGEDLPPYLSASLGAVETDLLSLTTAYAILANGGRRIYPSLIDRVQDQDGQTIFKHDARRCQSCDEQAFDEYALPMAFEPAEQVAPEFSVYQVTSMLRGVVERGTAQRVKQIMGDRPVAGKTGTTNAARDAWFVGFTPDLVVGVYVGFDNPKPLGRGEGGGKAASPIFANFMSKALEGSEIIPFRPPQTVPPQYIDSVTGMIDVTRMTNDGRRIGFGSSNGVEPILGHSVPEQDRNLGTNGFSNNRFTPSTGSSAGNSGGGSDRSANGSSGAGGAGNSVGAIY